MNEKEFNKLLKINSLDNLIRSLTKQIKKPLEVNFLLDGDTLLLVGLKDVGLSQNNYEFIVSQLGKIIEKEDGSCL